MHDMRYLKQEHLKLLLLDTKIKLIGEKDMFVGTKDASLVSHSFGNASAFERRLANSRRQRIWIAFILPIPFIFIRLSLFQRSYSKQRRYFGHQTNSGCRENDRHRVVRPYNYWQ